MPKIRIKLFVILCLSAFAQSCVIHIGKGNYPGSSGNDSVFGDVHVSSGQEVGNVSSVNGNITLSHFSKANSVELINGNIEIGERVWVRDINSINGSITASKELYVENQIETINGNIDLGPDSKIEKHIQTINGTVRLESSKVLGNIESYNGNISVSGISIISGDIVYHQPESGVRGEPELYLSDGVTLHGNIVLHRPVKLLIDNDALQQKVVRLY